MFGTASTGGGMTASPSVPPSGMNAPSPSVAGGGPNFLQQIFGALMDPDTAAVQMADNGMTPEDFASQLKSDNLSTLMNKQSNSETTSNLFGGKPMIDRGGYVLPKVGQSQHSGGGEGQLAQAMVPTPTSNIVQPGQAPGITAATPDNFITMEDVLKLFQSETNTGGGRLPVGPQSTSGMAQQVPTAQPTPQVPTNETHLPITPPVLPPVASAAQLPINPPVVPPVSGVPAQAPIAPTTETVAGTAPAAVASVPLANRPYGGRGTTPKGGPIMDEFIGTVRSGGLTNPNGLAAVASTVMSESGANQKNVFGSWNDPSEKGVSGTSGGAMSWRAERHDAMLKFVKENGGNTAANQAKFFLQENPELIEALNNAKSPEEAQQLMNNAWKFAGYDRPGGEAQRRIELAKYYATTFGEGGTITGSGENNTFSGPAGVGATGPSAMAGDTNTSASLLDMMAGLEIPESKGYQGIDPPGAVPPRPGQYNPNTDMLRTLLAMLSPQQAQVPSLAQLMRG